MDEIDSLFAEPTRPTKENIYSFELVSRGQGPYRERYRPQKLQEVVPTCEIQLLTKQIGSNNASQVFLLEGMTGTGKTTCAKILAKALVCSRVALKDRPCLECDNCKNFNASYDLMELNAANQNKVEDIRAVVDTMRYGPSIFSKKIYILDEVQRLTDAAQQVLLTELENPYKYLLVFLCTTDVKEINKALVDRACRVNFKKIPPDLAGQVIQQIVEKEKLQQPDENTIQNIYQTSMGSIRALLNNLELYAQGGFNPEAFKDETVATVAALYKNLCKSDWPAASNMLKQPEVKRNPETIRFGLENYIRGIALNTPNLVEAIQHATAMSKLQGNIQKPTVSQYNDLVLSCLRICSVFQ